MLRALALSALVAAPALSLADDKPAFFFKPNDRVVFLGDSITEQYQYSTYLELYLTTRFPTGNMTFVNAGIGGDTAHGGAGRFQSHVLDEKPTAITVNFGMNDAGYGKFNPAANKVYVEKTAAMLDAAKKAGARVALCSPNAVDRRVKPEFKLYVETQKEFYAPLKDLAAAHGAAFADQYAVTRAALEAMEKDDPKAEKAKPFGDGFHTSPPGGLLMAHAILTQLNAPAEVSNVVIELGKDTKATNAKVEKLEANEKTVSFTRTDAALPLPIQNDWRSMLPYTNQLKDLNYYGLTVTGLAGGETAQYEVRIDGKLVATVTAKELAGGVNLGNAATGPLFDQANAVFQAIQKKNDLVRQRFFGVVRYTAPDWLADLDGAIAERKSKELAKRMKAIDAAQAEVYKLAKPVARAFTITAK